jgi:DNA (cytosine-5)-methyltransferase 1
LQAYGAEDYAGPPIAAVDLFCGCGAVTLGLKNSGFRIVAAVDNNPLACRTYQNNHPEVSLHCQDIAEISPGMILERDMQNVPPDLLVVCAP